MFDASSNFPANAGTTVLCLHSSAGTGAQWRTLAQTLGERWRVRTPDMLGHGEAAAWPLGVRAPACTSTPMLPRSTPRPAPCTWWVIPTALRWP